MNITLPTLQKVIELKPVTYAVEKAFNAEMFAGVAIKVNANGTQDGGTEIPAINTQRATEVKLLMLTGLSKSELDSLTLEEIAEITKAINERDAQKKSV